MRRSLLRRQQQLHIRLNVQIRREQVVILEILRRKLHQFDVIRRQRGMRCEEPQLVEQHIETSNLQRIGDGRNRDVLDAFEAKRQVHGLIRVQPAEVRRGNQTHRAGLQLRPSHRFERIGLIRLGINNPQRRKTLAQPGIDRRRQVGSKDIGSIAGDEDERHARSLPYVAALVHWSPLRMPSESTYDCIIIGGGPAGLTCAIFLARYRRPVLVIDSGKPRNYASRAIHGFLGQHNIAPGELLARGRSEAEAAGAEICHCTANRVERVGDIFEVTTSSGVMRARRVVLAYGVRDTLPDIPDIESYYGGSVFHCADCDGYEVREKRVGVIGWGKKAVGLALKLLQWTDQLTIFTDGHPREWTDEHFSKLLALGIGVKDEKVISLIGDNAMVRAAVLSTGEQVSIDALFFTIGVERSCVLAEDLGCEVDDTRPNIIVDDHKQTSVEGIYAVGDLVPGSQLAITSAADGAIAAIAINKSLLPPSRLV